MRNRDFFSAVTANWPAKVLSVVAAIILFLVYRINILEERFFSVPLKVVLNDKYIPSGGYPGNVRITLRGNRDEIFLILEEDIHASVDLSAFETEGQFKVPVEIEKGGMALEINPLEIKVDPYEITFSLEEKVSKSLEVYPSMTGFTSHGYELAQYYLNPSYVGVEGPRSKVAGMKNILTEGIDLTGRQENFTVRVRLDVADPLLDFPGGNVVEFNGIIQQSVILKTFDNIEIITLDLDPGLTVANSSLSGLVKVQGSQLLLEETRPEDIRLVVDCRKITSPGIYSLPVKTDIPLGVLVLKYEPLKIRLQVVESNMNEFRR